MKKVSITEINSSRIVGVCFLQEITRKQGSNGDFLVGSIVTEECERAPVKVWGNSNAFQTLKDCKYQGKLISIVGSSNTFKDMTSIIIEDCNEYTGNECTVMDFLPTKYNKEAYIQATKNVISKHTSEKAIKFLNTFLFENEEVFNLFTTEFSAMSHHDNCKSGLLAHSYKVLTGVLEIITKYPQLLDMGIENISEEKKQDHKDIFLISALIHDIGKIHEMRTGVYQPLSFTTHREISLEMIYDYRDMLIEFYGDRGYAYIKSVLLQHHHEYGERAKTLFAYIVHLVDCNDAIITGIIDSIPNATESLAGKRIKVDSETFLNL